VLIINASDKAGKPLLFKIAFNTVEINNVNTAPITNKEANAAQFQN
jgi:hypothetical protein